MSVYIESVILDNFFVTLLLGKISYRALSLSKSRLRQLSAAVFGTAVAVLYPLLSIHAALLLAIKFALAASLVLILFYKKTRLLPAGGVFLALTFAFGGALFAVGFFVYADVETALRVPVSNLPVGLIILASLIAAALFRKIMLKLKRARDAADYIFPLEIELSDKVLKGNAFLDTGNRLYDPKTAMPVIVLGAKLSLNVLGDKGLEALVTGKIPPDLPDAHYIPYASAGQKNGRILIVKPELIRFYCGQTRHIMKEVRIGLSLTNFRDAAEYDILLHPAVVPAIPVNNLQKGRLLS